MHIFPSRIINGGKRNNMKQRLINNLTELKHIAADDSFGFINVRHKKAISSSVSAGPE